MRPKELFVGSHSLYVPRIVGTMVTFYLATVSKRNIGDGGRRENCFGLSMILLATELQFFTKCKTQESLKLCFVFF